MRQTGGLFRAVTSAKSLAEHPHSSLRKFEAIPGPKGPAGIGSWIYYTKFSGKYNWSAIHKTGFKKYEEFGSIVRETILPGVNVVWLFDPNDISKVLGENVPGLYPCRRSHLALAKYRRERPDVYRTGGLLPTNGEEWWSLRSELQKPLSSPKNVKNFLPDSDQIIKDFVHQLPEIYPRSDRDFLDVLSRLYLELTCLMTFNTRINSFSPQEQDPNSKSSRLIETAETTNCSVLPTDNGFPFWKIISYGPYKKLVEAQTFMESVAVELVNNNIQNRNLIQSDRKSLIMEYLENPKLSHRDLIGMAADLLLAGVDTTSYTTSFLLYEVAQSKSIQDKLYDEALIILPDPNANIEPQQLVSDIPYTRAVLKECLRMYPISVGVGRILNQDYVLSDYVVPKGTNVVTQNQIACRLACNFQDPNTFKPERWIRGETKEKVNPFLVLPFGHGMRACIARRFAEQNMLVTLIRIIRNYEIDWVGSANKIDMETKLINRPDIPIQLQFKKRLN